MAARLSRPSLVTTPEFGIQPGDQGNIITDTNGNVYNVFFDSTGTILYMAKSTDAGRTWMIKQVYAAPPCTPTLCISLVHVFPSIAADSANNLYIVFSDGTNSYYTSSTDGGASWRLPTIVQSGFGMKTTVEPWVVAGDAGKINIFFYGTTARNFMDTQANWVVYMAQSQNALAKCTDILHRASNSLRHPHRGDLQQWHGVSQRHAHHVGVLFPRHLPGWQCGGGIIRTAFTSRTQPLRTPPFGS